MARIKAKAMLVTFKTVFPMGETNLVDIDQALESLREHGDAEIVSMEASDEEYEELANELRAERID